LDLEGIDLKTNIDLFLVDERRLRYIAFNQSFIVAAESFVSFVICPSTNCKYMHLVVARVASTPPVPFVEARCSERRIRGVFVMGRICTVRYLEDSVIPLRVYMVFVDDHWGVRALRVIDDRPVRDLDRPLIPRYIPIAGK